MGNKMEHLFRPKSVAVIGASQRNGAIGNTTVKNFKDLAYKGSVYCVNPNYEEVEGFPCYSSAKEIPGDIDLAIITVPVVAVLDAVNDCAAKKVPYLIIFSGGFAETGEEGLQLQNEVLKICKEANMRIIGPNTMGVYNIKDKIALTFSPYDSLKWLPGNVGLVSQSGATGGTILNKTEEEKIGFAYMVTTGNQIDLNTIDVAEVFMEDEKTEIIVSYFEGIPDSKKLKEIAMKALEKKKPFIVLKSGRTEAGQVAVMSHTASLSGSDTNFDLIANQYGMIRVNDIDEIIDGVKAFNGRKYPKGNRVATVVISGATGIMLTDSLIENDQVNANLSVETKRKLKEVVPDYLSIENPVDIASTLLLNPEIYRHCVETLIQADEVDSIIMHLPIGTNMGGMKFAQYIVDASKKTDKPIIVLTIGTEETMKEIRNYLNENHIPAYSSLLSATSAIRYLYNYEEMYNRRENIVSTQIDVKNENSLTNSVKGSITEPEVKSLLEKSNIPVPKGNVGKNLNQLQQIARELKYPLVAKVVSSEITHKSDIGGVVLPINNEQQLIEGYNDIVQNMEKHAIASKVDGILLEELATDQFLEVFVGVKQDPIFGPVIMCGLGGIYVEIMKDISQRLAPVSKNDAKEMLKELKSYPLFTGYRKGATYDVEALSEVISKISELALNLGDNWEELEINPLAVFEEGKGVVALDGLIILSTQSEGVTN